MSASRTLHLNAFLMSTGHHEASWRLPESDPRASTSVAHFVKLAQTAERAKFDSVFFADSPVLFGSAARRPVATIEPTILLAALAGATERIGLIATASTSYNSPYNLARRFAAVDHVSAGRAGWNVVTTAGDEAARNFGQRAQPTHDDRYSRASEFLDIAIKLWDSWADDAVIADKAGGRWADPAKVRSIEHVGDHFSVHGALDVSRSPQGRPVIVQAGSSENGKDLAARYAEAVFTAWQTLDEAQAFFRDLKQRTAAAGRHPDAIKILPGIVPILGATETQARERERELDELILPEYARDDLARQLGVEPADLPLDGKLPGELPGEDRIQGAKSRYTLIVDLARREDLTVRELIGRLGGGRGHRVVAGTAEQIADAIESWFTQGAADGFNIMPPVLPSGLDEFADQVVPILQRRGLFRTEYEGTTLREHFGLERPDAQESTRADDRSLVGVR